MLLAIAGCEPSGQNTGTQPVASSRATTGPTVDRRTTDSLVGTWKIDVDRSIKDLTEIPGDTGFKLRHPNLDEYRSFVKALIEDGEFEIKADHKAVFRSKRGTKKLTWEEQGRKFWVGSRGILSGPEGHIFEIDDDGTGICKFQMEWSENIAPRSPLYINKVSDGVH